LRKRPVYRILRITRRNSKLLLAFGISEVIQESTSHMATCKLYVGGIPYRTTEDELRTAFQEAGEVASASIISDRMTGRSRGFGFVEMASEAEGQAAIDRWDGKELDGRMLSVSMARPQGDRPPREGGFGGNRGGFGGGDRGGNRGGGFGGGNSGGYQGGY
jgi:cold-inducible RNA-binding protein